jgi:DNA-binding MarR family transcriptional regulator
MGERSSSKPPATDGIDRLVHEPARLAIMVQLLVLERADFTYLMNETGLTRGNLSSHMSKLEQAGYLKIEKRFEGKTPRTLLSLTAGGRKALGEYRRQMQSVVSSLPA